MKQIFGYFLVYLNSVDLSLFALPSEESDLLDLCEARNTETLLLCFRYLGYLLFFYLRETSLFQEEYEKATEKFFPQFLLSFLCKSNWVAFSPSFFG